MKLQERDQALIYRELKEITDELERQKIPYWLDDGTLLGLIREGDFIPHDTDIDLGSFAEYMDKFDHEKLKRRFDKNLGNLRMSFFWCAEYEMTAPFAPMLQWKKRVGDELEWLMQATPRFIIKRCPAKYFERLEKRFWRDKYYYIPNNAEEYLTLRYGNWQQSDPDYDSSRDDPCIKEVYG